MRAPSFPSLPTSSWSSTTRATKTCRRSSARSTRFARARPSTSRLRVVKGHGNVGYGAGQNRALETVSSDYHLILNPDVFLEKDALLEGLRYLEDHAEVAMLGAAGIRSAERICAACRSDIRRCSCCCCARSPCAVLTGCLGRRVARYTYGGELPCDAPKSITLASGCFMLCRTDTLKKVNGFDERYFLYFEDYDLSLRVKNYGQIVELPQARITHYGGHTARAICAGSAISCDRECGFSIATAGGSSDRSPAMEQLLDERPSFQSFSPAVPARVCGRCRASCTRSSS